MARMLHRVIAVESNAGAEWIGHCAENVNRLAGLIRIGGGLHRQCAGREN